MTARLIKDMYGSEFRPTGDLFGLRCGQFRGPSTRMAKNNGWYNKAGEKLGWGDLSATDFQQISGELEDDELFIILGEQDSFWNFVTKGGNIGAQAVTKPDVEAPGVEYVANRCRFIIAKGCAYTIHDFDLHKKEAVEVRNGVTLQSLSREEAKQLISNS